MATQTKRTRSQLTITDYFSRHQAQAAHSPYKLAKEAARLNIYSNSSETTTPDPPNLEAHDEESLPSHNTTRPKKRSSSPFQREDVGGENGARVMKRVKRDGSDIEAQDASSDHRGMLPGSTQPSGPFDFSVISPRRPAPSSSSPSTPRRRAQSVPPSPSSAVPHFDLMKLESSPARAPSTSPTRQQLRFTSMPRVLEAIGDDMDVDVDADHLRPLLPLEQPATPHQTNGDVRIYATPRASDALDISVHSPLTPLPPTPAPFSHSVIHTSSDISSESVALSVNQHRELRPSTWARVPIPPLSCLGTKQPQKLLNLQPPSSRQVRVHRLKKGRKRRRLHSSRPPSPSAVYRDRPSTLGN
ncbi:hypothetical protein BV25DRAFT_1234677 [Artomyces pyxidatus]|uniref:Uncharacterized protein n=1 Tax=Artomyces pyxidatus TaxID=48021 RepID=A0ACB8SRR5_9AGAM|nr:hypothetical protein BV25DRAFT_1234677 [Artomyces pyxidatus]